MGTADDIVGRIGKKVRALRGDAGLTQDELASLAGISRNFIWEIETGRKTPSLEYLAKLADVLEVDLVDLLGPRSPRRLRPNPKPKTPAWLARRVETLASAAPESEIERFDGLAALFFSPFRGRRRGTGRAKR